MTEHDEQAATWQCGLTIPAGLHRARVNAELCRQIVKFMAEAK